MEKQAIDKKPRAEVKPAHASHKLLAVVRVRGHINLKGEMEDTMRMLRLHRANSCALIEANPSSMGMIKKAKDYLTWGPVSDDIVKELSKRNNVGSEKIKVYYLNPPRKGFGRKGIKVQFTRAGALGDRNDKINDLVKRML